MNEQEILRQKAPHYLLCFIDRCPLHATCLHWLCGQEASTTEGVVTSVNPCHPDNATDHCPYYREKKAVRCAKGMVNFYQEMPREKEETIKGSLISIYNRKTYYEYRNGVRLIPPAMQRQIARICRESGWTQEPQYDDWQDDFLW